MADTRYKEEIGVEDIKFYTGTGDTTFVRRTTTGAELTLHKFGAGDYHLEQQGRVGRVRDFAKWQAMDTDSDIDSIIIDAPIAMAESFALTKPIFVSPGCPVTTGGYVLSGVRLLSLGPYQQFVLTTSADVVFTRAKTPYIDPVWGGAVAGSDSTTALQWAVNQSAVAGCDAVLAYAASPYYATGLNFPSYSRLVGGSTGIQYGFASIKTIGSATETNHDDETCFFILNDSTSTVRREITIKNIAIIEDSDSTRVWGVYAHGVPRHKLQNVQILGFDYGLLTHYCWNSLQDSVNTENFRISGQRYIPTTGSAGSNNAIEVRSPYAATNVATATCNYDVRGVNSVAYYNLTSEGSALSHFYMGTTTRAVQIYGIHAESVTDFITVNIDSGSPTWPFGTFLISGGNIFLTVCESTDRFVKIVGTTANVGLEVLELGGGLRIEKADYASSIPADYFDLSRVANFRNSSMLSWEDQSTIDDITWKNIGRSVHPNFASSATGHNGLIVGPYRGFYTGHPRELGVTTYYNAASASMASPGQLLCKIDTDDLQERIVFVDVEWIYNETGFTARSFFAQFVLHINYDGSLDQRAPGAVAALYSEDSYALDTTFTYDRTSKELRAINATFPTSGKYRFDLKIRTWD